ncbi:unnamed protein product [Rotaria sp. Silwood2]|nr:unnamed protein product [Rotaria sp. Silwood2]CAF4066502.1 unnamed protein product [Rotaria sp. Silwood2]
MLHMNTSVEELSINLDSYVSFNEFKIIIQKFTHLTKLSVEMTVSLDISDVESPLNGFQWEQLISTYLPNLYALNLHVATGKKQLDEEMDSFETDFWIQHNWFVDFDYGILYTTPYMKRELTLSLDEELLWLPSRIFNRYNHVEILTLNFGSTFRWFNKGLPSFVFSNVCHLSLWFTNDYYESDSDGLCCHVIHCSLKPDDYRSVCIFLNQIVSLSNLQSLTINGLLPENFLIQLLRSTTNLTKLELDDWKGEPSNLRSLCRVPVITISTIF